MMKKLILLLLFIPIAANAQILFREDFDNLDNWKPLLFPKIKEHSVYSVVKDGENSLLQAEANASASGLRYKKEFDIYKTPTVHWRWKVENVLEKGDARTKAGDDYPIRIYVVFKYDPDKVGFGTRLKYNAARLIYGEYPPAASLNYVWANKNESPETVITSPYQEQVKMFPVSSGKDKLNTWQEYRMNILEDYKKAFNEEPPQIASIAIMSDADNTQEKVKAFIDFIEILR